LTPRLNEIFYWHFHPEYEIVYVETASGFRHIGDHISKYKDSDIALIGPNIPHLNFDYGVKETVDTVVVQMKENFLGRDFLNIPEFAKIKKLFKLSEHGLSFSGSTKQVVGEMLKKMQQLEHFEQLLLLLQIFQLLADSDEVTVLNKRPAGNKSFEKEQQRMGHVYEYIESNYQQKPDVNAVAARVHLTTAAFCRFFKKHTKMTFTDFVNQYRINQAKNYLLQDKSISETCYEVGFDSVSYFNKLFKKIVGENPSAFKKHYLQ